MKELGIAVVTTAVTVLIVIGGLSGNKILFIQGARSAAITLGVIGFFFCMISVGKFITASPAHPLSILGYIFGIVALLTLFTQIFKWNISFINDPKTALYVIAVCIVIKTVIGRFSHLIK